MPVLSLKATVMSNIIPGVLTFFCPKNPIECNMMTTPARRVLIECMHPSMSELNIIEFSAMTGINNKCRKTIKSCQRSNNILFSMQAI